MILLNRKIDNYIHNFCKETSKAVLITGARQIGKTYSIRQFGARFKSFVEVNFVEMPQACDIFRRARNSEGILQLYKRDISQYEPGNKLHIEEIFNLIPPELNAANKRFIRKNVHAKVRLRLIENSVLWLKLAGVALPVYNVGCTPRACRKRVFWLCDRMHPMALESIWL